MQVGAWSKLFNDHGGDMSKYPPECKNDNRIVITEFGREGAKTQKEWTLAKATTEFFLRTAAKIKTEYETSIQKKEQPTGYNYSSKRVYPGSDTEYRDSTWKGCVNSDPKKLISNGKSS